MCLACKPLGEQQQLFLPTDVGPARAPRAWQQQQFLQRQAGPANTSRGE
jgi:hypothetical protein